MSKCHIDFIGSYLLTKKYAKTLDDNMTYLLTNYMVYGYANMPDDLRDRFIIELFTLTSNNLKPKGGQRLGIQACYALIILQGMVVNMHESLTRSQVTDIVIASMQSMQSNRRSEVVLSSSVSTLNACMVYSPTISIDTMRDRRFIYDYISTLNKKLITTTQTVYDRRLTILASISMLRHAGDASSIDRLRRSAMFKFIVLLLDYHLLLSNINEAVDSMSLDDHVRYGNRQKDIMHIDIVDRCHDDDDMIVDDMNHDIDDAVDNRRYDSCDDDDDSMMASDDSNDFKNYDFDV